MIIATVLRSKRLVVALGLAVAGLVPAGPAMAECTAQQVGAYLHTECVGDGYRIRTTTIRVGEYVYSDTSGGVLSDPVRVTSRPAAAATTLSDVDASGAVNASPQSDASTTPSATDALAAGELRSALPLP